MIMANPETDLGYVGYVFSFPGVFRTQLRKKLMDEDFSKKVPSPPNRKKKTKKLRAKNSEKKA